MTETLQVYEGLYRAFDFFNARLWGGALPKVMLTLQREPDVWRLRGAHGSRGKQ